jgi:hypothetical protein
MPIWNGIQSDPNGFKGLGFFAIVFDELHQKSRRIHVAHETIVEKTFSRLID